MQENYQTYSYEQRTSNEARNASDIQNDIRDWQFQTAKENGFTNADKVNMETKGWKMFADSLAKKMDRSGANNAIGITDWIALSGGNPTNVALFLGKKAASSNLVKTGAIKLLSKQTKPSIIKGTKADIQQANFEKNVNRGISSDRNSVGGDSMVTPAGLIEAPTGQATGAKNFRVNQPAEKTPIKNEGQVGVRPGSKSQAQIKEEVQLAKQATRQSELKLITDDIASATERARYGGTGNTRIETQLNGKMDAGKLTREEAIDIATEILQDVQKKGISSKYKYIDRPKLEEYINDLYSNKKMPTFDDLLNESKPIIIPPSNAKQSLIKPKSTTTNVFGETIDKPSNSKGGFIKIPEIGKKYSPEGAIRTYTNSSDKINKMLREGKEYPQIEALDKFLTEAKKYDGTVYRGLTVDEGKYNSILENIRKNGIKDKAYTSTTENYGDATTYSRNSKVDGKKGIMFEIESKNGRVIDKKYNAYNEEEILFPRNTQFEYVGEYNDAGRGLIIKLKEKSKSIPVKNPLVEEARKYKSANDAFGGKDVLYHGTTMDNLESIFKKGLLNIKDDKSSIKKIYLSSNIKDSERYTKIYPSKKPLLLAVKDSIEFGPEGSRGVRTDFMSTRTISPKEIAFRDDTTGKWVLLSDIYKTPVKNPLVEEAKVKPKKAKK